MINSETQARHIFKRSVIRRAILSCILFSTAPLLFGFSNTSYANGSTINISAASDRVLKQVQLI